MRKVLLPLLFILFLSTEFSFAQNLHKRNHSINKVLKEITKSSDFKNASFGFLAIDAKTGQIISAYNADLALKPASNQKLISTATALELYGPDYTFETRLEYTGSIDTIHHVLLGDIFIRGGGDPSLGSKYFDQTKDKQFLLQWTEAVQHLGIDSIAGAIIGDDGIYSQDIVPPTWSWINMGNYFGAGACGLSIYDNYYTLFFKTDSLIGDRAEIEKTVPEMPFLVFDNAIVGDSISGDQSNILGAPYSNKRYLRGALPINKSNYGVKGSLPDPPYLAAYELDKSLKEAGVKIKEEPSSIRLKAINKSYQHENRSSIATTYSPPFSQILEQTNIHSVNLFAEHFLNLSGLKLINSAETEPSAEAVINFWKEKGMDTQGMALTDGSGLSQYNVVTPRQMVFLLNYMKTKSPYFDFYYNSLPIAAGEGTLSGMFKGSPAEGNLRAKSGTIARVKSYTGYVRSASGREIIFSMMVNNFSCSSSEARAKLERLMIALSTFKK